MHKCSRDRSNRVAVFKEWKRVRWQDEDSTSSSMVPDADSRNKRLNGVRPRCNVIEHSVWTEWKIQFQRHIVTRSRCNPSPCQSVRGIVSEQRHKPPDKTIIKLQALAWHRLFERKVLRRPQRSLAASLSVPSDAHGDQLGKSSLAPAGLCGLWLLPWSWAGA